MAKYTVEISHGQLELISADRDRIVFTVDLGGGWQMPPWIRHGDGDEWIDGKHLRLTNRSISLSR